MQELPGQELPGQELLPALVAGCVTSAAAFGLLRLAHGRASRGALLDGASGPDAHRKLQARPVPVVGGLAIVLGILAGLLVRQALGSSQGWMAAGAPGFWPDWLGLPAASPDSLSLVPALLVALAVGLADDLRPVGLEWRVKLLGQALVGLTLVGPGLAAGHLALSTALLFGAVCVVAQNAFNTFDNADGAATGLGVLGLAGVSTLGAGAMLGFLPYNMVRRSQPRSADLPRSYLGDSGSHALGLFVAAHPASWPVLLLPLCDLARLSVVRLRAGTRPWIGDRRHLAHRFERAGFGQARVLTALLCIAAPAILGDRLGHPLEGLAITAALFTLALGVRPRCDQPGGRSRGGTTQEVEARQVGPVAAERYEARDLGRTQGIR